MLHWNSIVEGATAGVAAAALIAIFAISRDAFRNIMLRKRVKRASRSMGCGTSLDGITVGIHNRTRGKNQELAA
jgi:hypothetical protein